MKQSSRIVVSGMLAGDPGQGGATWAVLQYILGFRKLGHRVHVIEPVRQASLTPAGASLGTSANAAYFNDVVMRFGLGGTASMILDDDTQTHGMTRDEIRSACREADVLFNISGMLTGDDFLSPIPVRVYLDLDPVFVQMWQAYEGIDMRLGAHTHHATVGLSIGRPDCAAPACGVTWIHTLPPVALDYWPVAGEIRHDALTTVANWRGYGSIDHDGIRYGQKAHSLREFMELPRLTREKFVLALSIHHGETPDLQALSAHGWNLIDPVEAAGTPGRYQAFIQGSKAEFGIAKSGYVKGRSGWFSDRSACYLASGRPVIAQQTGFEHHLPVGEGLFGFNGINDVLEAIEALQGGYEHHAHKARELAVEYFSAEKVLANLLDRVTA